MKAGFDYIFDSPTRNAIEQSSKSGWVDRTFYATNNQINSAEVTRWLNLVGAERMTIHDGGGFWVVFALVEKKEGDE